ncbi:Lactonase, 7-bladed beta-propeller-domain-containing protein [Zopfochytrium polystomum]|nr:Lactonase, 7-bladed beta-propeller-domain-containing protein [Zopfochytrium polystomum]
MRSLSLTSAAAAAAAIALGLAAASHPVVAVVADTAAAAAAAQGVRYLYFGTNASTIQAYELTWTASATAATGLSIAYKANVSVANPQYTVLHPTLPVVYAIERGATFQSADWAAPAASATNNATALAALYAGATLVGGGLAAAALDPATRLPTGAVLSRVPALGTSPDFVGIVSGVAPVTAAFPQPAKWPAGSGSEPLFLVATTYSTGSATVFRLDPATGAIQWPPTSAYFLPADEVGIATGNSRQGLPTAHHFVQRPSTTTRDAVDVFVTNLGTDRVFEFTLDLHTGLLSSTPRTLTIALGRGPRHVAFHPTIPSVAYIINEVGSTLSVANLTSQAVVQDQTTLAPELKFNGTNTAAEVVVHPGGRWVYASNRGEDTVAVFEVDPATGLLARRVASVSAGGAFPRYITLIDVSEHAAAPVGGGGGAGGPSCSTSAAAAEPTYGAAEDAAAKKHKKGGVFVLLVANHNSPNVVGFAVDNDTGLLTQIFSQATPLSVFGIAVSKPF